MIGLGVVALEGELEDRATGLQAAIMLDDADAAQYLQTLKVHPNPAGFGNSARPVLPAALQFTMV